MSNLAARVAVLEREFSRRRENPTALPDPIALAERAGYELDPWQRAALTSTAPRLIWNVCRQAGKSTLAALLAVHTVTTSPRSLVLLLSPGLRQSSELFAKCRAIYRDVGAVDVASETALTLRLANGSRITSLPGNEATVRGFSAVSLAIFDEASRVDDTLYQSVRPMLSVSGGRLLLMSTPWGRRGFFHQVWTDGIGWERVEIHADQCPRISAAFLAEEKASLPANWYLQEYFGLFAETDDQVFDYDQVRAALSSDVRPLFGGWD